MTQTLHPNTGVGLRTPHLDFFSQNPALISWLEVHSENYFQPQSKSRQQLRVIRNDHSISCHGVGLSLGSFERINPNHLLQLKELINDIE
ncbi:DUF692 family multinuclear iron-containing protein, partial [Vibrio cyclitrophicus]